ncbi:hypothetical protein BpHYR1_032295 [Brachionus plicatilis]|uniref:Uncharacterized protein n=1 Tax=Brachionus plicatilis TaxID=10195 RepID=A0A3M7Q5R8_BRAPC|nr:hypothetical protein BpHYR1_032295 [Brachionus plicatilis]
MNAVIMFSLDFLVISSFKNVSSYPLVCGFFSTNFNDGSELKTYKLLKSSLFNSLFFILNNIVSVFGFADLFHPFNVRFIGAFYFACKNGVHARRNGSVHRIQTLEYLRIVKNV